MTDSITYTSKVFFCQPYFIEKFSIQHECSAWIYEGLSDPPSQAEPLHSELYEFSAVPVLHIGMAMEF